jgi:nicotinamide mononucleotide transporter PnuC
MASEKSNPKKLKFSTDLLPLYITATLLVGLGIYFEQKFIKLLPTLISLVVYLLSAHLNRYSFLLAAVNSCIYAIGFAMENLYASVASALITTVPTSIVSFVLWSKNQKLNADKKEITVRRLNTKGWVILLVSFSAFWTVGLFVFKQMNTNRVLLDNTIFALGMFATLLSMLRYVESSFIFPISTIVNLVMWIGLTMDNLANITYVISFLYTLYRLLQSIFNWIQTYKKQNKIDSRGEL